MKKNRIHYFIIGGNFILGIGLYLYAISLQEGNGYEGLLFIMPSYICLASSVIYLLLFLIINVFIKKELNEEAKINFDSNQKLTASLREKKSIKLLTISVITYCIDFIMQLTLIEHNIRYHFVVSLITVAILILSGRRMIKGSKIFKIILIVVLFHLLFNTIGRIIHLTFLGGLNKDTSSTLAFVALIIAIAYLYVINILIKSKLVNHT